MSNEKDLKEKLTPIQYEVTQNNGTEPPFRNEYWNEFHDGIYVDLVSGKPLFSSRDKFDAGCGWPSFTKPLIDDEMVEKVDDSHFMVRTEVRSKRLILILVMYLMMDHNQRVCDTASIQLRLNLSQRKN